MSRLQEEFRVAVRTGVAVSAVVAAAGFSAFVLVADKPPIQYRVLLGILLAAVTFAFGFLVSYVYGDSQRRGMRPVLWTLIALFVPNALGIIAYFLLREPLLQPCPACGATARRDFAFCPQCGAPLLRTCPACRRPVEPAWPHCAHCGKKILGVPASPEPPPQS